MRNKRLKRRYERFVKKNKEEYDLHMAIYGAVYIIYEPWTIRSIFLWIIKKSDKPGYKMINPQDNEYDINLGI